MKSSNFICTVGPTNNSPERIQRMIYEGMAVARLNLSHGSLEEHSQALKNIQLAKLRCQERTGFYCPLGIAVDLRGPEIRIGEVGELGKKVKVGDEVKFNVNQQFASKSSSEMIFIDFPIAALLRKQQKVFIDDNSVELTVRDIFGDNVMCEVKKAGTLTSYRSIFVPDIVKSLNLPVVSEQDEQSIRFAVENDVDFIFASHVESGDWIDEIKSKLKGSEDKIKVYAKIQNRLGVEKAEEIISRFDGIIFQPTVDIEAKVVPFIQKFLLKLSRKYSKPCFTVITSELDQLEFKFEVFQAVNWFLNGGNGSIVTREAAKGNSKPLATMKMLKNIQDGAAPSSAFINEPHSSKTNIEEALASVCASSSRNTSASAIVILTNSQLIVHLVHQHRPSCEIVVVTEDPRTARQLNILDQVTPLFYKANINIKKNFALEFAESRGIIKCGDTIVLLKADENLMEIHYVSYDSTLR